MKKSLIFWFAAVTCAAWILVGCEQEPETKTVTNTNYVAGDIASLQLLLDEPGVNPVYYKGGAVPVGDETLVVPVGKTLVAAEGVDISTGTFVVAGCLSPPYIFLGRSAIPSVNGGLDGTILRRTGCEGTYCAEKQTHE